MANKKNLLIGALAAALGISVAGNFIQCREITDLETRMTKPLDEQADYIWQFRVPNRQTGNVDNLEFAVPRDYFFLNSNRVEDTTGDNSRGQLYIRGLDYTDPVLVRLANYLTSERFLADRSNEGKAQRIIDIAYALPRLDDGEYTVIRHPLNTLVNGGDCEDKARTALVLMAALGIDSELLVLKGDGSEKGHVAIGVAGIFFWPGYSYFTNLKDNRKFYYGETGGLDNSIRAVPLLGPKIGVIPEEFKGLASRVFSYRLRE